ncbi:uncharacterized protein LOC144007317 isoform X2 [Festucalex cinctus]
MEFPVDFLANVSHAELDASAHIYMNNLSYDCAEQLILSDSTKVSVHISRVERVPLDGSSDTEKVLALFSPSDPFNAVALYLLGQWWTVENILRTSDPTRGGIIKVTTIGERIVLYVLNRVIYRVREMNSEEEVPFRCHEEKDYAKICWSNGEAVGFYSAKPTGTLYNSLSTRRYQLPVMDSIFVRKCHRRDGFGLHMLEDFVLSFQDDRMGFRFPLTKTMYKMCEKYLYNYPDDIGLLWEVEDVFEPNQMFNIAKRLQTMDLRVSAGLLFTETPYEVTTEAEKEATKEPTATPTKAMVYTVEIVEDMSVCTTTQDTGDVPGSGRKKADMIAESMSKEFRVEPLEAETVEEHSSRKKTTAYFSHLVVPEEMFNSITEENANDDVGIAVEESVWVNTTKTQQEAEEAAALPVEENQGGEALMDTCCDPHMRNGSEIKGIEEESHKDDTSEEKDHSLSEGYDGNDNSTVLTLRGRSNVAEVNLEERKEVQEDENSKGMTEAVTVTGDNGENANNLTLELDPATVGLEKHKPGEDQSVPAETESSQVESTDLPKLQKLTVILVDLKTTHHQHSLKEVEKTEAPVECSALQKEETVMGPTGEKDASSSDGKEPKPEKPKAMSQENRSEESISKVCETAETELVKDGFPEKQNEEAVDKMKDVSVIQTIRRSERKKVKPSNQVIGHKWKPEGTKEFIQDNQEIYDQEGGLEDKAVDLQLETTQESMKTQGTISEAEKVADPAKETMSLRKRTSTLTTLPRSKRPCSNRKKGKYKL